MASEQWNSIDNYESNASEYYCAFLDILGYKAKAKKYFSGKYNLKGRFERALDTVLKLMKVNSYLIDISKLEVKFISDSIIILLPKENSGGDGLFGVLMFCALLSTHLGFEDLFVRGGISSGMHTEIENDRFTFLASIALQQAYIIESKRAIYPRILIDEEIIGSLSLEGKKHVAQDGNEYFVHFASYLINSQGDNEDILFKEMTDIWCTKNAETDESVIKKYEWILDYYYWAIANIKEININRFAKFHSGTERDFRLLVTA